MRLITAISCALTGAMASGQSLTTVFGPGGTVGAATPDAEVLNGLGAFSQFGGANLDTGLLGGAANTGQTLFIQIGPFYVGGAGPASSNPLSAQGLENLGGVVSNNRAYGLIGSGRSDITFTPGFAEIVTLQVRGSAGGEVTGTNPANSFGGTPTTLGTAAGTLLVYTNLGLELTVQVSNADFQVITLDTAAFNGDFITRISLINQGASNSILALGELTVTGGLVPTPAGAAVFGLAGLAAARRRR